MAASVTFCAGSTAGPFNVQLRQNFSPWWWYDNNDGTFKLTPTTISKVMTAVALAKPGAYEFHWASTPVAVWVDNEYLVCVDNGVNTVVIGTIKMVNGDSAPCRVAAGGLDSVPIVNGMNARQGIEMSLAANAGETSGAGTQYFYPGDPVSGAPAIAATMSGNDRASVSYNVKP
jgi:hypothetical protein